MGWRRERMRGTLPATLAPSDPRSIPRRLLDLALPVIGLNVLTVIALAVDTAMCGRLPDAEVALAALGFATQVIFLLMVAMMGLSVGAVALVSRAHGLGERDRVNHILGQASLMTVVLSLLVAMVGNVVAGPILTLLGATEDARQAGVDYLRPMLTGTVFYYLNILYASVLRGVGNTRLAFVIALGSNALNVVLNYGLILGNLGLPALGVMGAALGTVISQAVSVATMMVLLRRGTVPGIRLPLRVKTLDRLVLRELVAVGAPAALDMVILNVAFMAIVGMLGRVGQVAVAAHGIGLRIQALAFVPGLSVSQATSAMVGQALGASSEAQAREVTRASMVLCTVIMSGLAVIFLVGAHPIVGIFDVSGGELETLSVTWIRVLGFGMPVVGTHIALQGMLRGAGATNLSLGINLVATVLFQVPLSYILGFTFDLGALGIWVAFPFGFALRTLLEVVVYRGKGWVKLGLHA